MLCRTWPLVLEVLSLLIMVVVGGGGGGGEWGAGVIQKLVKLMYVSF